ncbi:MAG: helix-turn-helix domain-containing protein [Candidatus Nealsonbacteria bacterium]|nr:helix-turn-helix domain-containing protein [Candidatus Nealsonbacteria bacterium]
MSKPDKIFRSKRAIWVFITTPECPLRLSELTLYSYIANQAQYETFHSQTALSKRSGLHVKTVRRSLARLTQLGLLDDQMRP